MRRALIAVLAALPLTLGVAVAQADDSGGGSGGGDGTPHALVAGTVVSVDATAGTFVANAFVVQPESDPGDGPGDDSTGDGSTGGSAGGGTVGTDVRHDGNVPPPTTTQVTITTDSNTKIHVDGQDGTLSNLVAGQEFAAAFPGSPTDTIQTLVANPALAISAKTPETPEHQRQLYAFVGSVTAVDTTAGTVTVNVSRSLPSSLVPAGLPAVQFTVGPETLVLGGTSTSLFGGSLSDVAVGDIVAGGLFAPAGETLSQIEAMPLRVLLDLPAPATTTGPSAASAKARALTRALDLLGGNAKRSSSHHKSKSHKHSRTRSHSHHGHAKNR